MNVSLALFLAEREKLEISPVMKRPPPVPSYDEEDRHTDEGYDVDRQKDDELDDLPQAERAVDCTSRWLPQHLCRILCIRIQQPGLTHQILQACIDEDGIKDVHQGFIDEERFEKERNDDLSFSQHQNSGTQPRGRTMEEV